MNDEKTGFGLASIKQQGAPTEGWDTSKPYGPDDIPVEFYISKNDFKELLKEDYYPEDLDYMWKLLTGGQ